MSEAMSYAKSGVDIDKADATKQRMAAILENKGSRVLNSLGAFGSLIDIDFPEISDPVLVLKMEEPGSKQLLAAQHGNLASVGYDLVNHLLNDTVVMGAKPLAVLDTIICGELEKDVVVALVEAIADACQRQACSLVGGETSEQPRVLPSGSYILSASAAGIVSKAKIVDGSAVQAGDQILAVASNGVHTNGYTLIRSLLDENSDLAQQQVADKTFIETVLLPHLCYNIPLQTIFAKSNVHGLAHITGGGVVDNTLRILPAGVNAKIDLSAIKVLPIFPAIQAAGKVSHADMLRTFNMGVGLTAILKPSNVAEVTSIFKDEGFDAYPIGKVVPGKGQVELSGELNL